MSGVTDWNRVSCSEGAQAESRPRVRSGDCRFLMHRLPPARRSDNSPAIVQEVKETNFVHSLGADAIRVMRGPIFSDEQSTQVLLSCDATIDGPLRERLLDGSIKIVKCAWLALAEVEGVFIRSTSGMLIMCRCQELPPKAFFTEEEAAALLAKGDRSLLVLSHCWQTARHPDPEGTTLRTLRAYLNREPSTNSCGCFVEYAVLSRTTPSDHGALRAACSHPT